MSNPNAWNYFEQNHYQRFQDVCLNNPKEYGVARFADPDVNKKLKKDSEFIEIYHNDAQRTPCIVIETQKKISSIKDNDIYETQSHHYLYRDHNFLSQFGLDLLTNFDTTAGNLRDNIINGTHPKNCDSARRLDTTYDISGSLDIRDEQYREIKKLLYDPFSIEIGSSFITYENDGNIYEEIELRKYYKSIFRIITKDLYKSNDKNAYVKLLTPPYTKNPRESDFLPLLLSQSILIYRLIDNLREIQKPWIQTDRQRLWALRGIEKGSK